MTSVQPLKAMNLDLSQQMSFVRFYNSLSKKSLSTVRFFNHTDFYSVHEDDATLAADQVFSTNIVKYMGSGEQKLSYICLSQKNFDVFVRELLLVMQYRVEVYEKSGSEWQLTSKGSPGNLQQFEDLLLETSGDFVVNSSVMGVKIKGLNLGVCCVNNVECEITVAEFVDNEFFTELEALIAKINPRECVILAGNTPDLVALKKMLERNDVIIVEIKKDQFDDSNLDQDLNRLLYFAENQQRSSQMLPERNLLNSMGALQAVINYLNLIGAEEKHNMFKLNLIECKRYVRLDNAAIYSLNVINKPNVRCSDKFETVYGVLNYCCTSQGKRLLERWLKQPLRDLNILNERLNAVETLILNSELRNKLSLRLRMPDLLFLAKKIGSKRANLKDCYRIYQALENIQMIMEVRDLASCVSLKSLIMDPLAEALADMSKFQLMIEQTLNLDNVDRGEFLVKPTYDPSLLDLYEAKQRLEEKIQRIFSRSSNDLGLEAGKSIKLECREDLGYCFRVTIKEEPALRASSKYTIIDAVKGGVRFNNKELQAVNEDYLDIKANYEKLQESIVAKIIEVCAGYSDTIKNLNAYVAVADVLVSFATSAINAPLPFVRPKLLAEGSGTFKLKQARHPCLERLKLDCIPNDIEFAKDERTFKIITGPNMGGKSTFMRTVAVCALMAQIGSFVPCEEAEISLVDGILTRVGADDSDLKGMSTFMMEMIDTNGIIRSVTPNSLVIIDELGRGTSTFDGCGIAWSIAEYLAKEVKCFSLFATHYHELTRMQEEIPTITNLHVTVLINDDKIVPLFQIKEGVCDQSYGVHCAQAAGFPEDVLKGAREHQEQLEFADGFKYIKDYEPAVKQKIIKEGDEIIAAAIKAAEIENGEKLDQVKAELIRNKLKNCENLFVKGLLGI